MQYLKCTASIPGLLENTVLEFSGNPVVVFGKNGSGKTIIARSIIDVVYKKFAGNGAFRPDFCDSIYLDLQFSISQGGAYRIINNGNRYYTIQYTEGDTETILYAEESSDQVTADIGMMLNRTEPGSRLRDFIMRMSEPSFNLSVYVPSPGDLNAFENLDYRLLQDLMMNDRSLAFPVKAGVSSPGGKINPGDRLEKELEGYHSIHRNLEKRVQLMDISHNRLTKLYREKKNIQKEMRDIGITLASLKNQKNILLNISKDLQKIDECNSELDELRTVVVEEENKIHAAENIILEIDSHFPHFKHIGLDDIPSHDELQEIFNRIKNLNVRIDTFIYKRQQKIKRIITGITGIAIAGGISIAAILTGGGISPERLFSLISGIVALAAVLSLSLLLYLLATWGKKEFEKMKTEKNGLECSIKEKIKGNRVNYDGKKIHELYDFLLQYFEDYLEFSEKTREYLGLKSSMKDRESLDEINRRLGSLKNEENEIKQRISNSIGALEIVKKNIEINGPEIEGLIHTIDLEMERCTAELAEKERIQAQIENEINDHPDSSDEMAGLAKEREAIKTKLDLLRSRSNAMRFVRESLFEAEERREQKQLKKIVKNSVEKFNYLTGNQYITKIDERTVHEFVKNSVFPADLNPAVIHALVLSIKLSLTDMITAGGHTLPLVLDDPFYNMDEERVIRFKDLLDTVTKTRQVILFTHQRDTRDWGKYLEL